MPCHRNIRTEPGCNILYHGPRLGNSIDNRRMNPVKEMVGFQTGRHQVAADIGLVHINLAHGCTSLLPHEGTSV